MDAVQEVKAKLSIEDVLSEYVSLKRAGRNFKGLSPFTNERTPSFVVSPEKQIWHDFSSGRGGDMFTFIQEVEGLDFKGALELLARKAGVDLEQFSTGSKSKGPNKERLHETLAAAAKFYQAQLRTKEDALHYLLKKRGFSKDIVLQFQLGYSPDTTRGLTDYLLKKGFSEQELKLAGLTAMRRGGLGDMFRERIMVPLHDSFGRVVGFTARLLYEAEGAPKYINTPQTPLYDKSRHIYGLHLAKEMIRAEKYSVIVEGNLDVIASHQVGQKHVVATAGTAITEQHLKVLARFSPDVRLAFDQDRAGLEATERAIPIASKVGVNLSIITIPSGKDPDELIAQDPKLWQKAITGHSYALDWLIKRHQEKLDTSSAQGKREFTDVVLRVLKNIEDPVEQDHYVVRLSELIAVSADSLRVKLQKKSNLNQENRLKSIKAPLDPLPRQYDKDQLKSIEHLLCLALMLPGTRGYLGLIEPAMMLTAQQQLLLSFLQETPDFDGSLENAPKLKDITDYVKMITLQFEELYDNVDTLELQYEAARLRVKVVDYFVKQQKNKLSSQLKVADAALEPAILSEVRKLDQLLKAVKEV